MLDVLQLIDPALSCCADLLLHKHLEDVLHIAHQGDGGSHIFSDLRRVDVDVDDPHPPDQVFRLRDGTVRKTGSHDDEKVGASHRLIGIRLAVVAQHPEVEGMPFRQHPDAHHGGHHGDVEFFAEGPDVFFAVAQNDAAAGTDQGLFRLIDGGDHLLDLLHIDLDLRLIAPDIDRLGITEGMGQLPVLHVDGNVDEDRALPAGGGDVERLLEDAGDIVRVLDQVAVFDEGLRGPAHIGLLEHVPAQQLAGDLS